MASLSNQQFNTKSMTGLSDTFSSNIICDTFECSDEFTIDPGCVITLPANSIPDSALSTNVAFRNQNNTFSLTNIFSSIVQFTSTTTPVITQSIAANDATTKIPTTSWTDTYFGKKTLATGTTVQTWFGNNKFTSNAANLAISLDNTDAPTYDGGLFISSVAAQGNPITTVGNTVLIANGTGINTGILSLCVNSSTSCGIRMSSTSMSIFGGTTLTMSGTTCNNNITNNNFNGNISLALYNFDVLNTGRTRGLRIANNGANNGITDFTGVGVSTRFNFSSNDGSGVATNNFFISNGDTCYLQGTVGLGIGMFGSAISLDGICSFTNTTTPVITQAISLADNSTKIATTAFVKGQNYITAAALTPYALLAGPQTFTGDQNFVTQAISNNSTLVATTAFVKNQNYITSTALTPYALLAGPQTFTGDQNFVTQAISNNSTLVATTAFVKNQNYITSTALTPYALLAPTTLQTFAGTAQNTFNNQVNANAGVRFVDTFTSKISQVGNALIIENISNVNSVQIRSTTSGLVQRTGLLIQNGTFCELQGGSGNTITVSALNTPTLGIPPVAGVYSSEIATTNWVNTELTGVYARLNPTALQTWGTNENQFNTQVTMNAVATRYLNGANSSSITQTGNNLIIANISNSNSVQLRTNTAGGVVSQNVLCKNGNEVAIKGGVGVLRILNTACTVECGTFSSEAPYNCGYLTIGAPITSKTNFNIGYQWDIGGGAFNGTSWGTASGAYNILTIAWDGSGDKTLGVWQVDIVIIINCLNSPTFSLCWNTISNTSMDITEKCAQSYGATTFGAAGHQITRLSFTLNITNFLQNFWLNSLRSGGSALSSNTSYSQIKFTRIA